MASTSIPRSRDDFHVAILCALPLEADCVIWALDRVWNDKRYPALENDGSAYTLGAIGEHNVVVVHMPGIGSVRAASAASNWRFSYPNVKLALVVGICGGMPNGNDDDEEILLGDVVISKALVEYDFGKQYPDGFQRSSDVLNTLGSPNEKILGLLNKLETIRYKESLQTITLAALQAIQQKSSKVDRPGPENDILYNSSYAHRHRKQCHTCETTNDPCERAIETKCEDLGCEPSMRTPRRRLIDLSTTQPIIHIGKMGCANTVLKSGEHRDNLARTEGIIAVEMEGAGVWRHGPSIVIKGVCDYADSHKKKKWQRYAAATAAACAKAFLLEWWAPEKQESSLDRTPTCVFFDVPKKARAKKLFGRKNELTQITTYFDRVDDQSDRPRILVLLAMGGQGKSQIALEYCHRARRSHGGVFWVNGSSVLALTQSLVHIAQQLDRSATATLPDDDAKVKFAVHFLERWEHRWLLVFDNCDDAATFSELQDFLPQVGRGDILFTSRHRGLEELGEVIEVPPMPQRAGIELLLHRYCGVNIDQYVPEASIIVDRLGNLALAIDQASAYMQYVQLPVSELGRFLPTYLAQREKVLNHTTRNFWKYAKMDDSTQREAVVGAFTTWELSFQQYVHGNESGGDHVAHFLTLSAFFGQLPVFEIMFACHLAFSDLPPTWMTVFCTSTSTADEHIPLSDTRATWSSDRFWSVIYQAFQISLLESISHTAGMRGASLTLHPLIRDWLQLRVGTMQRQTYTREAISILASFAYAHTTRGSDAEVRAVTLVHMNSLLACDAEFFPKASLLGCDLSTCDDASCFASFYQDTGQYDASLRLFSLVAGTRTRLQGPEHQGTLTSMNNCAAVLCGQGKYNKAEQIFRQVVEVRKRTLGAEHPSTIGSIINLAFILNRQGKYSEAEQTLRRLVGVSTQLLGAEHSTTLLIMNNLAVVLANQGKYSDAEQVLKRAAEARVQMTGVEHPDTLLYTGNLAFLLNKQGKHSDAEQMRRQLTEVMERVLGVEHPYTLTSIGDLASTLSDQGKYGDAEQTYRQIVEASTRVLGVEHPDTLVGISNLAGVLSFQGKYNESEQMLLQVVEARTRVLGAEHPSTLLSTSSLATVLARQGKYDEAGSIQAQAVRASCVVLRP